MIIIGIDPGIATTGFGVIKKEGKNLKALDYGVITTTPKYPLSNRLRKLHLDFNELIKKYQPKVLAIEKLYFFKNSKTVISVSEAKGVLILTAKKKQMEIKEYTPLQIKTGISGYGRASKNQMQELIKRALKLPKKPTPNDAADALGAAICCHIESGICKI